jgi:hypothetical protein
MADEVIETVVAEGTHQHPHEHPHDHADIRGEMTAMEARHQAELDTMRAEYAAARTVEAATEAAADAGEAAVDAVEAAEDAADAAVDVSVAAAEDEAGEGEPDLEVVAEEEPPEVSNPTPAPREKRRKGWFDNYA